MIFIAHADHVATREPVYATWSGGTTALLYTDSNGSSPAFGGSRISFGTATIDRDAAYSYFPGIIRIHMPIQGNGIRLRFQEPDETVVVPPLAQQRFHGARPVYAELIDGPISAFNLMVAEGNDAQVTLIRQNGQIDAFAHALAGIGAMQPDLAAIYMVHGSLTIALTGHTDITLHANDTLIFEPISGSRIQTTVSMASTDAVAIMIIAPNHGNETDIPFP
jgi:environmental stress-induced protein Ves